MARGTIRSVACSPQRGELRSTKTLARPALICLMEHVGKLVLDTLPVRVFERAAHRSTHHLGWVKGREGRCALETANALLASSLAIWGGEDSREVEGGRRLLEQPNRLLRLFPATFGLLIDPRGFDRLS